MNDGILSTYEIVELYKISEWEELFKQRYVALYDKYDLIVGDISANMLRLTGFYNDNFDEEFNYFKSKNMAFEAPYFILKKIGD